MLILRLEIFVHLFTNYFSDQHNGVTCDCCKTTPIFGKRYKCLVCSSFDLCEDCHSSGLSPQPCDLSHEISLISSKSKYILTKVIKCIVLKHL